MHLKTQKGGEGNKFIDIKREGGTWYLCYNFVFISSTHFFLFCGLKIWLTWHSLVTLNDWHFCCCCVNVYTTGWWKSRCTHYQRQEYLSTTPSLFFVFFIFIYCSIINTLALNSGHLTTCWISSHKNSTTVCAVFSCNQAGAAASTQDF